KTVRQTRTQPTTTEPGLTLIKQAGKEKSPQIPPPHNSFSLSLKEAIKLAQNNNLQIQRQRLEWGIAEQAVKNALGTFEPEITGQFQREGNRYQNTAQESVSRSLTSLFQEWNTNVSAGVESQLPTGGKVAIAYELTRLTNNLQSNDTYGNEYKTVFSGTLTQPLLKGAGFDAALSNITLAKKDREIAYQNYRQTTMQILYRVINSYWDLYLSQEKKKQRLNSLQIAEKLHQDVKKRVQVGRSAATELLSTEAGVALRQAQIRAAEQDRVVAVNALRSLIFATIINTRTKLTATDPLKVEAKQVNFDQSMEIALKNRPEYLVGKRKTEQEDVRLAYAKNQRLPQLDLSASYGINGLARTPGESWDDARDNDYKSWQIGVELRVPLMGGIKSKSELTANQMRKMQVLHNLKTLEISLANSVDTAVRNVRNTRAQGIHFKKITTNSKKALDVERTRFRRGKSQSRHLLERERAYNSAKESELDNLVKQKKALLDLTLAEGNLLNTLRIRLTENTMHQLLIR
ncbi:TolC family protein, partial [Magnetococcales bacterium HHB-1]